MNAQITKTTRIIAAELLTPAAFEPYGVVLSPEQRPQLPINTYGDRLDLYRQSFESDQPIEWFIAQFYIRDLKVVLLERHHEITQAFLPLNGDAFLTIVARPDAPEKDGMIVTGELRAFIVPGNVGIQLHRGTWHENPIPLHDGQVILVTSHASITRGHQSASDQQRLEAYKMDVDRRYMKDIPDYELVISTGTL